MLAFATFRENSVLDRHFQLILPKKQSAFLWGARQTGKSYFLKERFKHSVFYDLLDTAEFLRLTKNPRLLREEVLELSSLAIKHPIVIDEIQKVPQLLNEVHWLIENTEAQFILCGSSARKLKTQSTNLLGGRAWLYNFFPLTTQEIPKFNLLRVLQHGLLPKNYLCDPKHIDDNLKSYIETYLTDEIRNEGLVRNLAGFARFLDIAGISNTEMINASNIATDCGVDRSTVNGFFQILVDTMLGFYVYPYRKKVKRDIITKAPKFYFFDVGVANYLKRQIISELRGAAAGSAFEHFILMELVAYINKSRKRYDITYWRSKSGLEVDFIIGQAQVAIEVKISTEVQKKDIKGMIAFCEEHPEAKAFIVSQDIRPRRLVYNDNIIIRVIPWRDFLIALWSGKIVNQQ